jgi:hypothetical protein
MYDAQTQQLSPEMVQAILALNQQEGERSKLNRQYQMANLMRQQGAQGQQATSPGGGRAGAPNWAGTLANIYAAKKANDMEAQADTGTDKLGVQRQEAYQRIMDALTRKQAAQAAQERPARMDNGYSGEVL